MSEPKNIKPPQWPLKLLRFLVKRAYIEEIEGDMEELFYEHVEQLSPRRAKHIYCWEVLRLFRPVLLKNFKNAHYQNQPAMFKNYFKVSIRHLMKYPLNSFINLFGLAVAIGICIFVYGFASWVYNTDQFHEYKDDVYLVTFFANRNGMEQQYGLTPRPLGEMLKEDFAQIKNVCRVEDRDVVIKREDNIFNERVRYTDSEFLAMFTFPLKWGNSGSLADMNSIILSEEKAIKYFGSENPIGQEILVSFGHDISKSFTVTGVAYKFPASRTIDFDFLINFENLRTSDATYDFADWNAFVNATLIQLDNPANLMSIERGMEKYRNLQNEASTLDWAIASFAFEPLATLHKQSGAIRDDISASSDSNFSSIVYLSVVGVLMLVLVCFNYINIAIVSAAKRLKEIGVRKSIGASRGTVIVQFLFENIVTTSFALFLGLALGKFVFVPWFEELFHFDMGFTLNDRNLWIYLPVILLVTGIASGCYPAFYVSKFQVVGILKGKAKFGKKNLMTKLFLGFQLILACIFVTSAVMFTQNSDYLTKRNWGYNQEQVLYVAVPDHAAFEKLATLMAQNPNVLSVSGSSHHLGRNHTTTVIHLPDRHYEVDQLGVAARYFETMGLKLTAGRVFKEYHETDENTIVVNKLFANSMLLANPVGQLVKIDNAQYEIIGVVDDFHSYSFFNAMKPTIFSVASKEDYHYLSMRVQPGSEDETYKAIQAHWAALYPTLPFSGGHQEDVWENYFEEIGIHGKVWRAIAIIAILLAGLGLYGLMTLNVAGRTKEFSIRKVMGAKLRNIVADVTSQYVVLFAVALAIGAPISFYIMKLLFRSAYTYHMPITLSGVTIAMVILALVLATTIFTQVRKVLTGNPVNGLKEE